jgi:hypothetical protein
MDRICRVGAVGVALVVFAVAGLAKEAKPKDAGKTEPPGVPLELRLVAKKATYQLDLGGKTADEFRKQLQEAEKSGKSPPPPAVDLVLELKNTGTKDVQVKLDGDDSRIILHLKGKGAVSIEPRKAFTQEFRNGRVVTLAPGKSESIKIKSLDYGFRGVAQQAYWTEAGEYSLAASYHLPVAPAPKGAEDAGEGFGQVTVTSAPVKITVESK